MSRPSIPGTLIYQIDLHHESPGKNKDYRITLSREKNGRYHVYGEWGPAGRLQNGMEKPVSMSLSLENALAVVLELKKDKIRRGDPYEVTSEQMFKDVPDSPETTSRRRSPRISVDSLSPASRAILTNLF
jgi:hypothetical protein